MNSGSPPLFTVTSYGGAEDGDSGNSDAWSRKCTRCGLDCRVVSLTQEDGEVVPADVYCTNANCDLGPPASVNQQHFGTPHEAVSFHADGSFRHRAEGRPEPNEGNVPRVAAVFREVAAREFQLPLPEHTDKSPDGKEEGIDAYFFPQAGEPVLLQVTRAMPGDFYGEQGRERIAQRACTAQQASNWIVEAVEKKKHSADPHVHLVVDGSLAVELSFLSEQLVPVSFLEQQGWRAIWVVGPSWLKCLWHSGPSPFATPSE